MLSRTFSIDGEDKPSRKPVTWEELAWCVDEELSSRIDASVADGAVVDAAHVVTGIEALGDGPVKGQLQKP